MNRIDQLREYERQLVTFSARWDDHSLDAAERERVRSEISAILAEALMVLERHLAEIPAADREVERYRLEFELPTFTYLRRSYRFFWGEGEGPPGHDPGGLHGEG